MCEQKWLVSRQQRWRGGWGRFRQFICPFRGLIAARYSEDCDWNIWLNVIVYAFKIKQSSLILSCSAKTEVCTRESSWSANASFVQLSVNVIGPSKNRLVHTRFRTQSTASYAVNVPLSACNMTYAVPCSVKKMWIKEERCVMAHFSECCCFRRIVLWTWRPTSFLCAHLHCNPESN